MFPFFSLDKKRSVISRMAVTRWASLSANANRSSFPRKGPPGKEQNNRQMALSSDSSLIYKNKYVRLAWVEGETLRWRTTYSIMQKKTRSGRLHKATSTRTDTCGEAAGAAQALLSRTSCCGVCVTCPPRDDGHTSIEEVNGHYGR